MASVTQRTDLNPPVLNVLDLTNQAIEEGDRIRAAKEGSTEDQTSFPRAVGAGIDLSQSLMWRFVENIADWQDWPGLQKMASEGAEMNEEQAAKYKRLTLAESEGLTGVAKWMHDTIGTQLPMLAVPLATGGLAAFAAMLVGAPAAVITGVTVAGAYAGNYVLNTGESYANQLEYGGKIDPEVALVTGGIAAILDTLVPGALLRRFGLSKKFNKKLSENLAKGTKLGNQFKRGFKFALAEGSTEYLQEAVYKIGRNFVNDLDLMEFSKEDKAEMLEGFYAGMLIGKGVGIVTPAGTAKAKQQVADAKTFDEAKKGAISALQNEVAVIGAKKGKETPEDRAAVKDIKGKIRELRKTKTLDEINTIIPPLAEDVPPEDGGPPAAPEVILRELGPTEVSDARTVLGNKKEHSDEEITEAEQVMRISVALKVKPKQAVPEEVLNIRILSIGESEAVDVTYDLNADEQGTYFYLRDQGAPHEQAMEGAKKGTTKWKAPITPPTEDVLPPTTTKPTEAAPEEAAPAIDFAGTVEAQIADVEAQIADLNTQHEAVTGSPFNKRRQRQRINKETKDAEAELKRLQGIQAKQDKTGRGRVKWGDVAVTEELPPPPAPAVPSGVSGLEVGVAPTAEQIRARQVQRDLAVQEETALREAAERNRLEIAERNRLEAEARAQARAEDEAEAAADAAEAEAAAKPLISVVGDSTLTAGDLELEAKVEDAKRRQAEARRSAFNIKVDKAREERLEKRRAEVEAARLSEADRARSDADRASVEAEKARASASVEAEKASEAETKTAVTQAQNKADDLIDRVRELEAAATERGVKGPTLTVMRNAKKAGLASITNEDAKVEFRRIVEDGIQEIESERSEAALTAEKARVTTETTREEGGKEPTPTVPTGRVEEAATTTEPTGTLTFEEFAAEYERIKLEDGLVEARKYFKEQGPNVNVSELEATEEGQRLKLIDAKKAVDNARKEREEADNDLQDRFDAGEDVSVEEHQRIQDEGKDKVAAAESAQDNARLEYHLVVGKRSDQLEETTGGRPAVKPKPAEKKTTTKPKTKEGDVAPPVTKTTPGPEEAAQARVISSPRDAIDAVKDGMEPDVAIVKLAEGMNVSPEEAWVAFNDETTQADAQEIIKSAEERGAVEAGTTDAMLEAAGEPKPTKPVSPSKVAEADKKKKQPDDEIKTTYTAFRPSRSGNYWTAKIANSPARIIEDEVGEFTAVYKGASYPTPFTSFEAAKRHLLETHGTAAERKKIKRPKVFETKVTKEKEKKPARKQKYAEPTVNKAKKTVQITYEPDVDVNRPYIRHFEGEPISRHETRPSAMHGLSTMDDAAAKEVIRIQEDRIARLEGKAVTQAEKDSRATGKIDKARAAAEDLGGSTTELVKLNINQQPLPSASHTIIIGQPNVKTDSPGETRFVNEVLEEEDMHPVTVSYKARETRAKDRTAPERFSESDTSKEKFNTFTPFVASNKKDALALSQSIYANAQKFHRFLQNEVSLQRNPMSLSLGLINDTEAFELQKAYQALIRQEKAKETRRKKLTSEQNASIERWEQKIQDLQTADGRSFKSTIVPGDMGEVTLDSFNDSLQNWIDQLEDTGQDTTALREVLANNKKKVGDTLEEEIVPRGVVVEADEISDEDLEATGDIYDELLEKAAKESAEEAFPFTTDEVYDSSALVESSTKAVDDMVLVSEDISEEEGNALADSIVEVLQMFRISILDLNTAESKDEVARASRMFSSALDRVGELDPRIQIERLVEILRNPPAEISSQEQRLNNYMAEQISDEYLEGEERDLEAELTELGIPIGDPDDLFSAVAAAEAKGTTVLEEQMRIRERQQYTEEQEAIEGAENVIPIDRITDRESFKEALDTFDSNIRDPEDDTFAIGMMEQEEEAGTYMSFLQEGIARFPKVTLPDSLFLDDGILRVNRDLVPAGEVVPFEKPVGLMEDVDDDIAQIEKDLDDQLRQEKKDRDKQKTEDKTDPDYILENENPADLYSKLTVPVSRGGYSATEVKSLAANIKAANPDFEYNPKGKKADVTASIMEWYTKPMDEGYAGTAEDQREYKDTENDDVIESRRLDSKPDFLSPDRATSTIGKAVNNIFGERIGRRMLSIGFINLINSSTAREMGASSTAQAFVSRKNGAIYFISDRIGSDMDENSIRGLMFHELGVHLGKDVFSGAEWNTVLNEVYNLSKANDPIVNAAVARVMKAYDYKKIDSGQPAVSGKPHVNFQGRREFWEEVLAHVVEIKQPGPIIVNNKLTDKIRNAFRKFFDKIFKAFGRLSPSDTRSEPSVTIDDLVNLVGYSTTQAGVIGLERHGDSKLMSKFRDKKRREFLEGSKVKEPMYHGTKTNWGGAGTHPFIEIAELGLHVGTSLAAIQTVTKRRGATIEQIREYGATADDIEVRAFEPGWERKISNRDLGNIYLDWGKSSMETPEPGTSYPMGRKYTTFYDNATVKQGYINVQNPLSISTDIGGWDSPYGWNNEALRVLSGDTPAYLGKDGANKNIKSIIPADEDVWVKISNLASKHMRIDTDAAFGKISVAAPAGFEQKLRELLISEGYDSVEYVNNAEDVGSTSYILLSDNQFKSIDDLAYDSGVSIFSTKKGISATTSSNIQESRRVERESFKEVALSRIGNARASSISNWIQRRVEPLMTIPGYDMLETERMLAKGRIGEWANTGRVIFDILNNANPAERKAIFKYFTTRDANPKMLSDRKVEFAERQTILRGRTPGDKDVTKTESLRDRVVKTKELISKLGQDLVDEGFISNEQYSEWKEQYLPRVYLEHVLGGTDKAGFGFRMSPLTYTKTRKEHEKFMKDLVSGRIDDPAFLSSRYVSMAGSDMAIKSYLDYIASDPGNNKWVLPGQVMTFKKMKGTADYFKDLAREIDFRAGIMKKKDPAKAKQMEALSSEMKEEAETVDSRLRGVDTSKYTKVPDSPRFGAMRGLYVMRDIWTDINGLGIAGNPAWGGLLKWSGRAQKVFKYTKVPMNIPTQIRNIISNTILMNVSGTNLFKIPGVVSKAVYDVSHNGKYMQLARKYGLESTTFASEELVRIDRELATVKARGNSFDGMWARLSVFFDKYLDVGGRAYQKSEVLFKVAKMIDLMENHGKGEAEAAKLANEALLDYSNVSQGIRMLRTMPLGSPFITFNVKAAAQMVRNIKQHPLATAKYAAIPYLFAEMFLSQNDDLDDEDWDALMEFLPDYMETSFSTMVFPTKNEQGKWEAVDISFFLPWGAHLNLAKDMYKQEWGNAVSGTGMFAGPWEIPKAIQLNEDPFTKQPIWNEFDPARQRYEDILGYLASYMIPPMLMPRNRAGDIVTGGGPLIKTMMAADFIDGNVGRDGLPRYTMPNALLSWFGVSVQQLGRADVIKKGYYKQKDLDNINKRFLRMINEPAYAGNSAEAIEKRKELREQYREHWLKKYKEGVEWAEHLKSLEKLFSETKKT